MKHKKWLGGLFCLLLAVGFTVGPPALADAAVEDWWTYSYDVDRDLYVNPADNLGLFMRYGPGTEYEKVNSQTIPMYTKIHITQECTAENGWKWGYCEYQFPGKEYPDSGWVCLVETTTYNPAPAPTATPETATPKPSQKPSATGAPELTEPTTPVSAPETDVSAVPDVQPDSKQTPGVETTAPVESAPVSQPVGGSGAVYTTLGLVLIGIVVGAVATAALLLLFKKKK